MTDKIHQKIPEDISDKVGNIHNLKSCEIKA